MTTLAQVFGSRSSSNPLSYVVRDVEHQFRQALADDRFEAIVIYGTSRQGKSSLRRSVLPNEECTFVSAAIQMNREGLYKEILNQTGAEGKKKHEVATTNERTLSLRLNPLKWLGDILGFDGGLKKTQKSGATVEDIDVDLSMSGTVARRYKARAGKKPIVIDNFHYIEPELQRQLATDIRAFGEYGIKIIILGTWKAQDYIQRANSDLVGRVCALSIEPWKDADLLRVLELGEPLLNVRFSPKVRDSLLQKATGNVTLIQDAVYRYLHSLDVLTRCDAIRELRDEYQVRVACRAKADELLQQTAESLQQIARIGPLFERNKTKMHWIIRAFLQDPQVVNADGVELIRIINRANHMLKEEISTPILMTLPETRALLKEMLLIEQQKLIKTPIVAFDEAVGRLVTLDSLTLFTIRHHKRNLLESL
jgi:hypothetical protein